MRKVLIVTDKTDIDKKITHALGDSYNIDHASGRNQSLGLLNSASYDIALIDIDTLSTTPDSPYQDAMEPFLEIRPRIQIIIITPVEKIRHAVRLIKAGAADYIMSSVDAEELRHVIDSIHENLLRGHELDYLRDKFWRPDALKFVDTRNPKMREVFHRIRSVAPTKSTVLLTGETGTGKNLIARLIHLHSNRKDNPFISVHCGAIPDTLIESELFGHEKGAFTGAIKRKIGKFEMAKGGTIFLDEIGTITPMVQIKMLQVLQEGAFSRVGGEESLYTDARIITATNSDLRQMTEEGRFRRDLFYRLNVFPIEIPPLRDRMEDMPLLLDEMLKKLNRDFAKRITAIHPHVLKALRAYHWPGNIRELENVLERAFILETSASLNPESFPVQLFSGDISVAPIAFDAMANLSTARQHALEEFERQYLKELLSRNKGKINNSALEAGISTRQLYKLMTKYDIRKEEFRS